MNKSIAKVVSYVMHPLFVPLYLFLCLFYLTPDVLVVAPKTKELLLMVVGMFTCLLPLLSMTSLYLIRWIDSFHLADRLERRVPFMLISFVYAFGTIAINWLHNRLLFDPKVIFIIFSITISSYVLAIITFFWKISAHALALGGTLGILITLAYKTGESILTVPIALVAILLGITMSSRLALSAHSSQEVWVGALTGILVNLFFVLIFWI